MGDSDVYFGREGTFPFAGETVLTAKSALQDVFGISYFAEALVNGEHSSVDRILQPGDLLIFQKRFGFKGSGDVPLHELQANGLLRTYPGLLKIAREVKAMRLNGVDSVDETLRMVVNWCQADFGPVLDPVKATLDSLVKRIQTLEEASIAGVTDGPTDFGELWYEGELYDLKLTSLEIQMVRALWHRKPVKLESVCEAVYGDDDQRDDSIRHVKKRANKKLSQYKLKIISRNGSYCLTDIESDGEQTSDS